MTHNKCQERRAKIAEAIRAGQTRGKAALQYHVCVQTVHRACVEHGISFPYAPAIEKREHRKAAALEISKGTTVVKVLAQFGMSRSCLRRACEESGVPLSYLSWYQPTITVYRVIARLQAGDSRAAVAGALDISPAYVSQIVALCRKHGVNLNGAK